jgi:small neutral amino acid transporter SnatA (MarC family)
MAIVLIIPLLIIMLIFVIIYAQKGIYWITSMMLLTLLTWLVIPSSQGVIQTIVGKALFSLIVILLLLSARYFSRLYQRRGMKILKEYWKRK